MGLQKCESDILLPHWVPGVAPPALLPLGDAVPVELEVPVEASHVDPLRVSVVELESVVVDDVDNRTNHRRPVEGDAVQQRFQPA